MRGILAALCILLALGVSVAYGSAPPKTISVEIPECKICRIGGFDYVDIPGGGILAVVGKPRVPFYWITLSYPPGYRVQRVILSEKSRLTLLKDLNLPIVTNETLSSSPRSEDGEWYPGVDYDWEVFVNPDGSSTLFIYIYPFQYDQESKEAKFYRHYKFNISYIFTTVSIADLRTNQPIYRLGDEVEVEVTLNNTGREQDVTVEAYIKTLDGKVIMEMPARILKNIAGLSSITLKWNSRDAAPGDYQIEIILRDKEWNWLDKRTVNFRLGKEEMKITNFRVKPRYFKVGDEVEIFMEAENMGCIPTSGAFTFIIKKGGVEVWRSQKAFSSLSPGESMIFKAVWNTSSAEEGAVYHVLGYVRYGGRATSPSVRIIGSNMPPTATFTFSPKISGVGEEVTFNAAQSTDQDGAIKSYMWNFGDGGKASGVIVKHRYRLPGRYHVTLTVIDDHGASDRATCTIKVVMLYTLNVSSNIGVPIEGSGVYKEGDRLNIKAPTQIREAGLPGLLGARYVFKGWRGCVNATDNPLNLTFKGYRSRLFIEAIYEKDYSRMYLSISVLIAALAAALIILARKKMSS